MQKIYYGAPGTGKSFAIKKYLEKEEVKDEYIFRTTFHPEYTYNDFVGQLVPVVKDKTITYSYKKGVFTLALEKAYENTAEQVYLIIEEMSRGNCAGIFGDLFQLLDRENTGINKGYSDYFINNDLLVKDIPAITDDKVKLPPNFHIFGTVNTSDQNVFAMDTAFKRRFDWEYISTDPIKKDGLFLNNVEFSIKTKNILLSVKWIDFYQALNEFITSKEYLGLGEDKQIGQFFIDFTGLNEEESNTKIKNKVMQYLWFDIAQNSFSDDISIFDNDITSFKDLYEKFGKEESVFSNSFLNCLSKFIKQADE